MPNFHIEGRQKAMKDIQRNFLFEVSIPEISSIVTSVTDEEEFIIRSKTASIPDRGNTPIESYFMSMKQIFPGRLEMGNTLTVDFEDTEDQKILKAITEWQDILTNTKDDDAEGGHAKVGTSKRNGQTTNIFLKMYKYDGTICENMIKFVNGFPSSRSEVGLDYAGNETVRYSITFTYDYWNLITA